MARRRNVVLSLGALHGTVLLLVLVCWARAVAVEHWTVGGQARPWNTVGTLELLSDAQSSGWLEPLEVSGENLALNLRQLDSARVLTNYTWRRFESLKNVVDGDRLSGWPPIELDIVNTRENNPFFAVVLVVDLGAPFGVDRIGFSAVEGLEFRFIEGFQVFIQDGKEPVAFPQSQRNWHWFVRDWELVAEVEQTEGSTAHIEIPPRLVRYVALSDTISLPSARLWQLGEVEVWGKGYASSATFTSDIIDFGEPVVLGAMTWDAVDDPGSTLQIRTRSGSTPDPNVYLSFTGIGQNGQQAVSRSAYEALHPKARGPIVADTKNWTPWSAPYPSTGRESLVAPKPARYFQFEIDFASALPLSRSRIDSLSVEFSPPLVEQVEGEIWPALVSPGKLVRFTYALRPRVAPGDPGFDGVEIATPTAAVVQEVRIAGIGLDDFVAEGEENRLRVSFPGRLIDRDAILVEVDFDCRVFVAGTRFAGRVFNSKRDEMPQPIVPGDVHIDLNSEDLLVGFAPEEQGKLLAEVEIHPSPFTPNGDGVNDWAEFTYNLFQATVPVPVEIAVHDLSGRLVWHQAMSQSSGFGRVFWDGRDGSGQLVAPGVYIYRVSMDAAVGAQVRVGAVAVAY